MRHAAAWVALGVLVVAAGCAETGPAPSGKSDQEGGEPGAPFPLRFEAERVDGGTIALESLRGNVVLVDLFGTWCPPCRSATPALVSLYERYHGQGFEIVGLAYERTDTVEEAKAAVRVYQREFKVPYVLAIGSDGVLDLVPGGFEGYPTMLVVDRQGMGRAHYVGFQPGEEQVLADAIETLLAEPAGE